MGVKEETGDIITAWPDQLKMRCYTQAEIHALSVVEVTQVQVADRDGEIVAGGLHDLKMGPTKRGERCHTCDQTERYCPGHCGHIDLAHPCLNPLFYNELKQLIVATCYECGQFLCQENKQRLFEARLEALSLGSIECYNQLRQIQPMMEEQGGLDQVCQTILDQFKENKQDRTPTRTLVDLKAQLVDEFFRFFARKIKSCPRCNSAVPILKFETMNGQTKIYQEKTESSVDLRVDSDGEDDDEDEEMEPEDKKKTKNTKEVKTTEALSVRVPNEFFKRHITNVFKRNKRAMKLLYTGQKAELLFIDSILVPPNKFRPMNKVGGAVSASTRTVALKNIVAVNEKLKWLQGHMADTKCADYVEPVAAEQSKIDVYLNSMPGATLNEKYDQLECELQTQVNIMIDSNREKQVRDKNPGAKQRLEKKSGLFRMNIMGKRVNYCARTVITPDPKISTSQFGVPAWVAKRLTYNETVTEYNYGELRKAVINGPENHPGAEAIIDENGKVTKLDPKNLEARRAMADQLLTPLTSEQGLTKMKKVKRHLRTGDAILANRQPTLHKGSIMAHRAKVTKGEYTFRLHYANCKHYNADFDGDEMNLHLPQTEEARAEAEMLMCTEHMFRSAKDGYPLAGLMQDHIIAGVTMTMRGRFFTRDEYQDLLYVALSDVMSNRRLKLQPPAIFKPQALWSGKQVVSTLIQNLCGAAGGPVYKGACMSKPKTTPHHCPEGQPGRQLGFSNDLTDGIMYVRHGYICSGVFDKSHGGPGKYGIVAAIEEIFGGATAGNVISGFGRMFTHFLQNYRGFTLGIKDVTTNQKAVVDRQPHLDRRPAQSMADMVTHFKLGKVPKKADKVAKMDVKVRKAFRSAHLVGSAITIKEIDSVLKGAANKINSDVEKASIDNLSYRYPENNLEMMIQLGAKGSRANLLNMTSALGQVELDGKRAPLMPSGRSLPCYKPYEYDVRAGAYIGSRYGAGGLKPQEYFFHCMAGRDGLIDTSCKTASSGYLQRCLIKHLEGILVAYDRTVRDHDKSVVQFHYGEDGIDVAKTPYLKPFQFDFIAANYNHYVRKYFNGDEKKALQPIDPMVTKLQKKKEKFVSRMIKNKWKERNTGGNERVQAFNDFIKAHTKLNEFANFLDTIDDQEARYEQTRKFNKTAQLAWHPTLVRKEVLDEEGNVVKRKMNLNPTQEQMDKKGKSYVFKDEQLMTEESRQKWIEKRKMPEMHYSLLSPDHYCGSTSDTYYADVMKYCQGQRDKQLSKKMQSLLFEKYRRSLVDPGDQVGLVISQSIGEPSTQMTLNTFHLAGKADVNITLGIPRLRELLMTAPKEVKTPSMTIPFHSHITKEQAEAFVRSKRNVVLRDVITKVSSCEKFAVSKHGNMLHTTIKIEIGEELCVNNGLNRADILKKFVEVHLFNMFKQKLEAYEKVRNNQNTIAQVLMQKSRGDGQFDGSKVRRGNLDEEEGDDIEIDVDDGAEYGDSDREGQDDEEIAPDEIDQEEDSSNDEGIDSGDDNDIANCTLDNIDTMFNMMGTGGSGEEDEEMDQEELKERSERIRGILQAHTQLGSYTFDKSGKWCAFVVNRKPKAVRIDLVKVVSAVVADIKLQGLEGITKVTMKEQPSKNGYEMLTEGINFDVMYNYAEYFDLNRISSNDINQFANKYGVEAGAATIKKEIEKVFEPYGIKIDGRHTSLIADYMTQEGGYRPFSRHGLASCASPIQKASYETTSSFLVTSVIKGECDDLTSPSARIAAGQLFRGGTNYFDLRQQIMF